MLKENTILFGAIYNDGLRFSRCKFSMIEMFVLVIGSDPIAWPTNLVGYLESVCGVESGCCLADWSGAAQQYVFLYAGGY